VSSQGSRRWSGRRARGKASCWHSCDEVERFEVNVGNNAIIKFFNEYAQE